LQHNFLIRIVLHIAKSVSNIGQPADDRFILFIIFLEQLILLHSEIDQHLYALREVGKATFYIGVELIKFNDSGGCVVLDRADIVFNAGCIRFIKSVLDLISSKRARTSFATSPRLGISIILLKVWFVSCSKRLSRTGSRRGYSTAR